MESAEDALIPFLKHTLLKVVGESKTLFIVRGLNTDSLVVALSKVFAEQNMENV